MMTTLAIYLLLHRQKSKGKIFSAWLSWQSFLESLCKTFPKFESKRKKTVIYLNKWAWTKTHKLVFTSGIYYVITFSHPTPLCKFSLSIFGLKMTGNILFLGFFKLKFEQYPTSIIPSSKQNTTKYFYFLLWYCSIPIWTKNHCINCIIIIDFWLLTFLDYNFYLV